MKGGRIEKGPSPRVMKLDTSSTYGKFGEELTSFAVWDATTEEEREPPPTVPPTTGSSGSSRASSREPSSGWKTTQESIEEATFWHTFGWAIVVEPENRNTDRVPHNVVVDFPCPVCGSVWGELQALGFHAPKVHTGRIAWTTESRPVVYPNSPYPETYIWGVRIVCLEGHRVEYDSVTKRHRHVPTNSPMAALLVGGLAVMALTSFFLAK